MYWIFRNISFNKIKLYLYIRIWDFDYIKIMKIKWSWSCFLIFLRCMIYFLQRYNYHFVYKWDRFLYTYNIISYNMKTDICRLVVCIQPIFTNWKFWFLCSDWLSYTFQVYQHVINKYIFLVWFGLENDLLITKYIILFAVYQYIVQA